MITQEQDYLKVLHQIQNKNHQTQIIKLPPNEPICEINLDTRIIDKPKSILVDLDHNSETVYFSVDRFFDNVDLSTMTCVVQYENANPNKKQAGYYYAVPYFDLSGPDVPEGKMLFQWAIEGSATLYPGKLTFAIQFYRTSEVEYDDEQGKPVKYYRYDYLLNTLPNFTTVQHGMDTAAFIENYESPAEPIKAIFDKINAVNQQLKDGWQLYWIDLSNYDPNNIRRETDYSDNTIDKTNEIYSNISLE